MKLINDLTPAQGVELYRMVTNTTIRDSNLGRIRFKTDFHKFYRTSDPKVKAIITQAAREVWTKTGGSRVRDINRLLKNSIPAQNWGQWSGANSIKP